MLAGVVGDADPVLRIERLELLEPGFPTTYVCLPVRLALPQVLLVPNH